MRVTLEVPEATRGSPGYGDDLARALAPLGVNVRVRRLRPGLRVGPLRLAAAPLAMPRLGDVVHATDHALAGRRCDVVSIHDLVPYEYPGLVNDPFVARRDGEAAFQAVSTARRILVPSDHVRQIVVHRFRAGREQVQVVPLGIDAKRFRPDLRPWPSTPFRSGRLNVVAVMDLDRRNRADLAARAALALPDAHFVHVGADACASDEVLTESYRKASLDLAAQGRYTHRPEVHDNTLRGLYSQADVVLHLSMADGFARVPLEAMACGARVIASDIPVHRELLGAHARFVEPRLEAVIRELVSVWDGQAVRDDRWTPREQRLAHAQAYTWERTARETMRVYREAARPS